MTGLPASLNRYPMLSTELIVAGLSDRRAQKCTKLAAVARTGPADRSFYSTAIFFRNHGGSPPCLGPLLQGARTLLTAIDGRFLYRSHRQ